ncbi:hypothetical protein GLYMA_01G027200v4 [Glycine max]|uniref:Uncharacterized protein n=1 Tax=Glycine max TaxID=3847 RepID=A0A0R0L5N8_SOYBN|nr:hypothetical protein JHK86_000260 [Glycine max]KAH1161319.1 hypothetical protein GYH30_000280 [Glycine max]KRH74541.1 hypothetical protein GLYMA_01G027200v4 [Glycine max]
MVHYINFFATSALIWFSFLQKYLFWLKLNLISFSFEVNDPFSEGLRKTLHLLKDQVNNSL